MKIHPPKHHGFTLVELLVTVGIIGILTALLFGGFAAVKKSANMASSVGRQRSLGQLFQLYLNDNQGCFPNAAGPKSSFAGGRWPFYLASYMPPFQTTFSPFGGYVNGIVGDWAVYRSLPIFHDPTGWNHAIDQTYGIWGYNANLCDGDPIRANRLSKPSTFPVLASAQPDISGLNLEYGGPSPMATKIGWKGTTKTDGPAPMYGRKALFLFADWHVAAVDVCDDKAWPWDDALAFSIR